MAVYAIPNLPVYSPLAGIAELYKEYKGIQRQEAQDAYAKEKDAKTLGLKERELEDMRVYQQGVLENQQGQRQENYASNWMRNDLARQELEQRGRVADCNGADKNTPACIQARQAGAGYAVQLKQLEMASPEYAANRMSTIFRNMQSPSYDMNNYNADMALWGAYNNALAPSPFRALADRQLYGETK
jgi:hypothetical protein